MKAFRSRRYVRSVVAMVAVAATMLICPPPIAFGGEVSSWPSALSDAVTTLTVSGTVKPTGTLTIPSGKTLIVKGSGTLSGGSQTLFDVQSGGKLVLDAVTVSGNTVDATQGAVHVANGGLVDLGFNNREVRTAPSITNNTTSASAQRNLVVASGARVRLNARANKAIGISFEGDVKTAGPQSVMEGGRYVLRGDQDTQANQETNVTSDDASLTLAYSNDHLLLRNGNTAAGSTAMKALVWNPARYWHNKESSYSDYDTATYTVLKSVLGDSNVTYIHGTNETQPKHLTSDEISSLNQYDLIVLDYPWIDLHDDETQALNTFLNNGGRIFIQLENPQTTSKRKPTLEAAQKIAKNLGAGFDIDDTRYVASGTSVEVNTESERAKKLVKGLSKHSSHMAAYIYATSPSVTWLFKAKTASGQDSYVISDQDAGNKNGKAWGALTVCGDGGYFSNHDGDASYGKKLMTNLMADSHARRLAAATGSNPNESIDVQATITPTDNSQIQQYRSPAAGLAKADAKETYRTVKLTRNSNLTPANDELLFSRSSIEQTNGGTVTAPQSDETFIDVTSTGRVNLRSGEVTVSNGAEFTVAGKGVDTADNTKISGGYSVTSSDTYTAKAADASSPLSAEQGGTASLTASKAGQTFSVVEPSGKTVTYKATAENEVFYLGRFSVDYSGVSAEAATVTKPTTGDPWHKSDYTAIFKPTLWYGGLAVKTVDANGKETDITPKESKGRAANQATMSRDANTGAITVTVKNVQSNLKFIVTKTSHSASVTYKPNGADGSPADVVSAVPAHSESVTISLNPNQFTKSGWTLFGWSETQDGTSGTFHKADGSVTLKAGSNLDLYAVWHKVGTDGSVTLPGKDGRPGSADDVTIKPGAGAAKPVVKKDDGQGYVETPTNSTVSGPNGDVTITTGPANVYPDGTIKVPEGGKVTLPGGGVVEGPATIDPSGSSNKPVREPDGTIVLPGSDGKTGTDDDVVIKPGNGGGATIDKNGNVTLPAGGEVTYPKQPNGSGSTVKVPSGTTVDPNGSMTIPEGGSGTLEPAGTVIPGGSKVDAKGDVIVRVTIRYVDANGNDIKAPGYVMVPASQLPGTLSADEIPGYKPNQSTLPLGAGTDLGAYTITFTYTPVGGSRDDSGDSGDSDRAGASGDKTGAATLANTGSAPAAMMAVCAMLAVVGAAVACGRRRVRR